MFLIVCPIEYHDSVPITLAVSLFSILHVVIGSETYEEYFAWLHLCAEVYAELYLLDRGRDQGRVHIMWSYKLLKQSSAIFHHVFCSEAMTLGLIYLEYHFSIPVFILFLCRYFCTMYIICPLRCSLKGCWWHGADVQYYNRWKV